MSFYRWCMRHGAAILFVVAAVQLVLGLIGAIQSYQASSARSMGFGPGESDQPLHLLLLLQAVTMAFTTAALPFFGALVINRLDRSRPETKPAEAAE